MKGSEGPAKGWGAEVGHPGVAISTCNRVEHVPEQGVLLREQGIFITLFTFYTAEIDCHNCSSFKQRRFIILRSCRSEVWYRSHQAKIKVSFPGVLGDVFLLIWIIGKIQFFGCYGTESPISLLTVS